MLRLTCAPAHVRVAQGDGSTTDLLDETELHLRIQQEVTSLHDFFRSLYAEQEQQIKCVLAKQALISAGVGWSGSDRQ